MARPGVCVRGSTVVVAAVAVLAAATACGDDGGGGGLPQRPSSPHAGPTSPAPAELPPEERAAVDEVLEVLDSYLEVFVDLATEGVDLVDMSWTGRLGQYGLPDNDLASDRVLIRNHSLGHLGAGQIGWSLLEVVEVDLDRDEPWVMVEVCIDETGWTTVQESSGDTTEPRGRYRVSIGAVYRGDEFSRLRPDPAWRLTDWDGDRAESC